MLAGAGGADIGAGKQDESAAAFFDQVGVRPFGASLSGEPVSGAGFLVRVRLGKDIAVQDAGVDE